MSKIDNTSGIPEDELMREGLIDRLSQYLEAEPGAWHVRYNLGVALAHVGRYDEALEHFRQVLTHSPKHLESLVNIGGIHLARGEADQAMAAFTKAMSVYDTPLLRANLAVAYMQKDRLEEAEQQLLLALEANPKMPDALTNLSLVLLKQGKAEDAVAAARAALAVRDDFAMAYNNLAAALLELGRRDEAKEAAAKAVALEYPVHEEMLQELGLEVPA
ncbi:MAG: tetratricopeptide repeat protein [Deltaproteobacteria bacterium]|nr:tetratricopeptide repeat protein [Deltaproteobacteria bacterium]